MPTRRNNADEGPSAPEDSNNAEAMRTLLVEFNRLCEVVSGQQQLIQSLQAAATPTPAPSSRNALNSLTLKAPPIPTFTGIQDERNSLKVKGFICGVRRFGRLSSTTNAKLLQLAEGHLQDRASAWLTRLETNGQKPTSIEELQKAMIQEFVPTNEKAKARISLMNLQMSTSMEKHIGNFTDLVELCETPVHKAYTFFFMSLPDNFKSEFAKKYPSSDPDNMQSVYDHARTIEMSQQRIKAPKIQEKEKTPYTKDKDSSGLSSKTSPEKDPSSLTWGPAKRGEGRLYRDHDRCCKCGKAPWSDPEHPCR